MEMDGSRDLTFHEVLEAVRTTDGCSLCSLEAKSTRRYLESLLWEFVNDPPTRSELLDTRGYCHRHAHILLDRQDGLGIAILYRDQVDRILDHLQDLGKTQSKKAAKRLAPVRSREEKCPACRIQLAARASNLAALIKLAADPELRAALESSSGLCIPHFLLAIETAKDNDRQQYLVMCQRRSFERLRAELGEFIRRHDYRFSHESFGKEADSWLRAVKMLVGERQVFPL